MSSQKKLFYKVVFDGYLSCFLSTLGCCARGRKGYFSAMFRNKQEILLLCVCVCVCVFFSCTDEHSVLESKILFILKQRQSNPITGLGRPSGVQEVEATRCQGNLHMKISRMSSLRTGLLYPPGNIPGTHFCYILSRPQDHGAVGIEPATLRFVSQCLNQSRHRVDKFILNREIKYIVV